MYEFARLSVDVEEVVGDVLGLEKEVEGEGVASEDTGVLEFLVGLGVHD